MTPGVAGPRAWWLVAGLVIGGAALAGSTVEIFHGTEASVDRTVARYVAAGDHAAAAPVADAAAAPARSYLELREGRRGPNAEWRSHVSKLVSERPPTPVDSAAALEGREATLATRAERRAYDGAPPVVPHVMDPQSSASCVACHGAGLTVGTRVAPVMPHPPWASCAQCHVEGDNVRLPGGLEVDNAFVGMRPRGAGGGRAWAGAPPVMPHTTHNRDDCASCHGVWGAPGLRTTHPERQSCTQCHAPGAELDGRPLVSAGPW
ncbi:MAG: hypothetical protein Q8L86_04495 [Vicinamibacterales bacterium]|nr:hypothetical protein [Vicinamibacterales bacterium]